MTIGRLTARLARLEAISRHADRLSHPDDLRELAALALHGPLDRQLRAQAERLRLSSGVAGGPGSPRALKAFLKGGPYFPTTPGAPYTPAMRARLSQALDDLFAPGAGTRECR